MKPSCLILMTLLALAANVDAEIYKWVDEEGNVHYSDSEPPPTHEPELIEVMPGPSEDEIKRAKQRLEALMAEQEESKALGEKDRLERERQQVAATQVAIEKKRVCIRARQNLHELLMRRPVYYIDDRGERVFLDDEMHVAEIGRMGELIAENCLEQ